MPHNTFPIIGTLGKNNLQRTIAFLIRPSNTGQARNTKSKIVNSIQKINFNVHSNLELIARRINIPIKITLQHCSPPEPLFENNINEIFQIIYDSSNLRIITKFEEYNIRDLVAEADSSNISHLVEIDLVGNVFGEKQKLDLNSEKGPYVTVYPKTLDGINRVIEDILLDITMYHSIIAPFVLDNSFSFRRGFSTFKASFALDQKIRTEDWNPSVHKTYISLAGYFRGRGIDKAKINVDGYIKCWNKLFEEAVKTFPENFVEKNINLVDQLKFHKNFKILPIKTIQRHFKKLEPGRYFLVTTKKVPKNGTTRKSILGIFGKKQWRNLKYNLFIKDDDFDNLYRYSQWLTFFPITKQI